MLNGHGDDLHRYKDIRINFSSNVYNHFDHSGLFAYLAERMPRVTNYPEPVPYSLERELADHLGIQPTEVMVTNGATEAIYLIAQTFEGASSSIIQPTFSEYADACRLSNHIFGNETDDLVWLCNPNNPTGLTIGKEALKTLIAESPNVIFIIDASYAPFTLEPLITAAEAVKMPNVLMLHSMTKEYAIPGLRLGYVTGCPHVLAGVKKRRMPWSVNQLAQDAGHYLLTHHTDYQLDVPVLMAERERVAHDLAAIPGIEVLPSDTHILLCRVLPGCCQGDAAALKDYLAQHHGILIRDASNFEELDASFFRIAVQSPHENNELINAISQWIR